MKTIDTRLLGLGLAAVLVGSLATATARPLHRKPVGEANKALVRRFVDEVYNQHKIQTAGKYITVTSVDHMTPPGGPTGLEGFKKGVEALQSAFPDGHVTINDLIAESDKVVIRSTFQGTQKGELMGVAPTGKTVTVTAIDIVRVKGGKMVEHWGNQDDLGLMRQIGAIPPPGSTQKAEN
jgi:predicted ester cyclase